jgi:elongation factor G
MEKLAAPWPLLQIAIEPKRRADQEKLTVALSTLADEDSWFVVKHDAESGQTIVAGRNERHFETVIDRLRREFNIEVNVSAPQVAYREAITLTHEQDYTHKKQSGGSGQFARVKIVFGPNTDSWDFLFGSRVVDGAVPDEYVAGVEKGVRSVLSSGPFAGFPMLGIRAILMDGACHDTDSSALAFEVASRACFREAAPYLGVQLLEPIMQVEVVTPEIYVTSVVGELHSRRGLIQSRETRGDAVVVHATAPLAAMFKLADALRSHSKGQASMSVSYAGYAPVPLPPDDRDPSAAMAMAR